MNRKKTVLFSLCVLLLLVGCMIRFFSQSSGTEDTAEDLGSFTAERTYSYDEKYYAVQEMEEEQFGENTVYIIKVSVYETETDAPVFSFSPARARDFWGICWEKDTYNIWTQSADIGIYCYKYEDGEWKRDETAKRPAYIISKWDKK